MYRLLNYLVAPTHLAKQELGHMRVSRQSVAKTLEFVQEYWSS